MSGVAIIVVVIVVILLVLAMMEWGLSPLFAVAILAVVVLACCAGCVATLPVVPARTAIPIECKEPMPERPVMPTEQLGVDAPVDAYVQAAAAEIERREGYEGQLRTSLASCIKPVKP